MTSDGPGPPRAGGSDGGSGRRPLAVQVGEELHALRRQVGETSENVAEVAEHLSRLSPRVDDLEQGVAALSRAVEAAGAGGGGPAEEALSLTPALRWSRLEPGDKHAAWDGLAAFVAEVLGGEYRLSRVELPDCWPVHPRAVRELAWLRTLYIDSSAPEVRPDLVAEWHVRWLPAAVTNLAAAIDARECAPGKHRLTEEERRQYHERLADAERAGQPAPRLTSERGAGRPRYLPDRFPPRRSYDDEPHVDPARSGPRLLDAATPTPASSRDCWWEYFLEARMADTGTDHDSQWPAR